MLDCNNSRLGFFSNLKYGSPEKTATINFSPSFEKEICKEVNPHDIFKRNPSYIKSGAA